MDKGVKISAGLLFKRQKKFNKISSMSKLQAGTINFWIDRIRKITTFGLPIGFKIMEEVRSHVKFYRKLFSTW